MFVANSYTVECEDQGRVIYPKDKDGETRRVVIPKRVVRLTDSRSGVTILFSRYRSIGRWFNRDSRDKKPTHEREIRAELRRMLGPAADQAISYLGVCC